MVNKVLNQPVLAPRWQSGFYWKWIFWQLHGLDLSTYRRVCHGWIQPT